MPPTDPTPTPREVLDAVLASPNGRAIAAMYGPEFTGRTLPSLVQEILAALAATGDAPLAGDELAAIRRKANNPALFEGEVVIAAFHRLLTAYTTLAAQCAAVRAERDALESEVRSLLAWGHGHTGLYTDDGELSCGECLLDFRRDSLDVIRRRIRERKMAELAALATPARPTDAGRDG